MSLNSILGWIERAASKIVSIFGGRVMRRQALRNLFVTFAIEGEWLTVSNIRVSKRCPISKIKEIKKFEQRHSFDSWSHPPIYHFGECLEITFTDNRPPILIASAREKYLIMRLKELNPRIQVDAAIS